MTLSGQGYRCSAGETFDSVALAVYGDEKYACEILNANPALCTIPVFRGGEILEPRIKANAAIHPVPCILPGSYPMTDWSYSSSTH